jgi:hypothetical protein
MSLLSLLVDGVWTPRGVVPWSESPSDHGSVFSVLFFAVLYVRLGLLLASVGSWLRSRWTARHAVPVADRHVSVSTRFVQKRLAKLDRHFFSAKIGLDEYQHRRKQLTGE